MTVASGDEAMKKFIIYPIISREKSRSMLQFVIIMILIQCPNSSNGQFRVYDKNLNIFSTNGYCVIFFSFTLLDLFREIFQ